MMAIWKPLFWLLVLLALNVAVWVVPVEGVFTGSIQ